MDNWIYRKSLQVTQILIYYNWQKPHFYYLSNWWKFWNQNLTFFIHKYSNPELYNQRFHFNANVVKTYFMGHLTIILGKTGGLYVNLWSFKKKEKKAKRKVVTTRGKQSFPFVINFLKNMIFSTWKLVKNCN